MIGYDFTAKVGHVGLSFGRQSQWVEVERPPTSRQAFEALDATYWRGVNNRNSIKPMSLFKKIGITGQFAFCLMNFHLKYLSASG